jgi:hypothetical protein
MSVPALTGMNLIDNADTQTNWSGWGNNTGKWNNSSEIKLQGSNSNACQPNNTGDSGWGYDSAGGIDLTANLLVIPVYIVSPAFVNTMDNKGIYIRICSGSTWTGNYCDYYMGGSDVKWCGNGWHFLVLDANRTADATNGTTTKTAITNVGVGFNVNATASKSDVIAIDAMYYGTGVEATSPSFTDASNGIDLNDNGGSADTIVRQDAGSFITDGWEVGDYVRVVNATTGANDGDYGPISAVTASTLTIPTGSLSSTENNDTSVLVICSITPEDIFIKDGATDDKYWGVVAQGPQGNWILNYPLTIGDVSGALNTFFLLLGTRIIFADQALDTTREDYLITAEDTGETHVRFGSSDGTGDSRVGYGGAKIFGEGTDFDYGTGSTSRTQKTPRGIDFDAEITRCDVFGSIFVDLDGGCDFAVTGTDHYITNNSFESCGQIDTGGIETRNITITGYTGTDGGFYWRNGVTDIKNSFFLANVNDAGTSAAIEHDTASAGQSYIGLRFAGNDYDIHFTAASGDLTINASTGLFDSNPVTSLVDGTGSVTINNTKTYTVDNLIAGSRVYIYKKSDDSELASTDSSGTSFAYPYSYTGDINIYVRVLNTLYEWITYDDVLTSSDKTTKVFQRVDRNYENS